MEAVIGLAEHSKGGLVMTLINISNRGSWYMGLITLSSALSTITVFWAGLVSFGLSVLVIESVRHLLNQTN